MTRLRVPSTPGLRRRQVLQLGGVLGLTALAGCTRGASAPLLQAAPEILPSLWRRRLPRPWRFEPLELAGGSGVPPWRVDRSADLRALSDGWLPTTTDADFQPIAAAPLQARLAGQARRYLELLGAERASRVLPVAVTPWVMLFRGLDGLDGASERGWQLLLDPDFKGQVVLPASPRLVMELADQIPGAESLARLRSAALTLDDQQGLNWLLQGKARVAVLPLQRCIQALRRDPRLRAVLPDSGAPLHWTLLMRPASSREPLPQAWVEDAWGTPLLRPLLGRGWRPPLAEELLDAQRDAVPASFRALVLPTAAVWARCWSLPPLKTAAAEQLSQRWRDAAP